MKVSIQNIYILMTLISHSDMVGEYLYLESLKRFDSIFIIIFIVKIIDAIKNNKINADPLYTSNGEMEHASRTDFNSCVWQLLGMSDCSFLK